MRAPATATSPTPAPTIRSVWLLVMAGLGLLSVITTTVVVVVTNGRDGFDIAVLREVPSLRTADLTPMAQAITALGSVPVVIGVALLTTVALAYRTRSWVSPVLMLGATAMTACTVFLLKIIVGRPRPSLAVLIGAPSTDGSFPSGHTTDGSVVWVLAGILLAGVISRTSHRRLIIGVTLGLAAAIGCSRIYLGYHWATDVLAGWMLAAVVLGVSCLAFRFLSVTTLSRAPMRLASSEPPRRSAPCEQPRRRP